MKHTHGAELPMQSKHSKNVSQGMIEDPEGIGQSSGDTFWKGKTSELPRAFSIHPLGEIHDAREVNAK